MANRKLLFRSGGSVNEVSPSADVALISAVDSGAGTFSLKTSATDRLTVSSAGLMTMAGNFSLVPSADDTGTIGVDPGETGGDPLGLGVLRRFAVVRARRIKAGATITLENSIDITNSADGVSAASTGRIKYESATQALRVSENGGALDDVVLRTKAQTLTNKTITNPVISDFTSSQHSHQNAAGGGQLDHGLAITGLLDDDHTQYVLLAGRSGGQLVRGGTGAGDDLQLQSTSHATRGRVIAVDQFTTQSTATKAALQIGSVAGDPSSLANGDVWYNSSTEKFRARENGVSVNLISAGGSGTLQDAYDNGPAITTTAADGDILFTRGATAAAGDELLHLVDANASAARTSPLFFVEDANDGSGVTQRTVRTAGTGGVSLIEGNSTRALAIRNNTANADALVIDTVNGRLGLNRIATVPTFAPAFDFHYQSQGNGTFYFDTYATAGENFDLQGRKAEGTFALPTALSDDSDMWEFSGAGYDGTAFSGQQVVILFEAAGAWSGTNHGTRQVFKTTEQGTTTLVETFVLGDDGCVIVSGQTNGLIGAVAGEYLRVVGNARVQGTVGAFTGTDANPTSMLSGSSVLLGVGGATAPDVRWRRVSAGLSVFDNNTAKRPLIVDAANNRIGGSSIDDVFAPAFDVDFEKQGSDLVAALTAYGATTEIYGRRANGTKATPTVAVSGDDIFRLNGAGWDGDSFEIGVQVNFEATETWSATARGARLIFSTTPDASTTLTERYRVEQNGNLIMNGDLDIIPGTDGLGQVGTAASRFGDVVANLHRVFAAASDANPTAQLSTAALLLGAGGGTALDSRIRRAGTSLVIVDNNGTNRTLLVDAANRRIGLTTVDDTFTPGFTSHVEHQTTDLNIVYDNYGNNLNLIGRRSGGTKAAPTDVGSGLDLFLWGARGWEGGAFSGDQGTIEIETSQAWSAGAHGTQIRFRTTPNGSTTIRDVGLFQEDGDFDISVGGLEIGNVQLFEADRDLAANLIPNADISLTLGSSARRFTSAAINQLDIYVSASDANPGGRISFGGWQAGPGGASAFDSRFTRPGVSQFRMDDNASGAGILFNVVAGSVGIEAADGAAFAVSGASTGRLRYNNTTGTWQYSTQGGAYASFPTGGSGTTNTIPKWTAGTVIGDSALASDANNRTLTYTPAASVAGSPTILTVTGPAHTTLAAAEATDVNFNLARSVQFTTGAAIANQRAVRFQAPTYTADAPTQTLTIASTLSISGPPVAGTNVAITSPYALRVESGESRFDGAVRIPTFKLYSEQYIMGSGPDLSLIPVAGGQSVVTTWWGLQLVGNKQSGVEYTPANIGAIDDFSVAIPCQQASKIGLLIRGQTAQTGNLLQLNNIGGTGLSCFDEVGRLGIGTVAPTADVHVVQAVATSGTPTGVLFTAAAHTALTAAEAVDVDLNMGRTVQFTTGGTIASQRAVLFRAPTYGATAATQTITDAATLAVTAAPAAGTNVTITRSWNAWFQAGAVRFDGDVIHVAANDDHRLAVGDANPATRLGTGGLIMGAGGGSALDARIRRTAASTFTIDNNGTGGATIVPATTNTGVIGTDALKWNRIRATSVVTGDLEMKNEERGAHWLFEEHRDRIVVTNKITGKKYEMALKEIK